MKSASDRTHERNDYHSAPDKSCSLIEPYGGKLINLIVSLEEQSELTAEANALYSIQLSEREICDLELLAVGAFSPLDRFMNQADYRSVLSEMRLSNRHIFPIPVTLSVEKATLRQIGESIALRDAQNNLLAVLDVAEIYEWQPEELARKVFGTNDSRHPSVAEMNYRGRFNLSGRLRVLRLPFHRDFQRLRLTPNQVRERLAEMNHFNVVAFQTRNPLHRAHEEMTKRAMEKIGGTLLLHPVVGITKIGDVDYFTRVRTYQELVRLYFEKCRTLLAVLPLAMRFAGPREAVWHALVRRNYGANHFIVGRDHASPGLDSAGKPFYAPEAARRMAEKFSEEIGVKIISFDEFAYLPDENRYEEVSKISSGKPIKTLSGSEARAEYLYKGRPLPEWFTRPEVAAILAENYLPKFRQGACLWFTGLSGAGKTATAELLAIKLTERGRQVTVLDGDVVRTHLSKGLGFSKADRDTNVRRIGFVAAEIVRHGGLVICAAVSPYRAARNAVREMVGGERFIEVFVSTPLEVCEARDSKGMYEKARRGAIKNFTGIDEAYESPLSPEITLETIERSAEENAHFILEFLINKNFLTAEN